MGFLGDLMPEIRRWHYPASARLGLPYLNPPQLTSLQAPPNKPGSIGGQPRLNFHAQANPGQKHENRVTASAALARTKNYLPHRESKPLPSPAPHCYLHKSENEYPRVLALVFRQGIRIPENRTKPFKKIISNGVIGRQHLPKAVLQLEFVFPCLVSIQYARHR